MTAHGDDPRVHRIEVDLDDEGLAERVRFVCEASADAACRHWPDCECETWGGDHFVTNDLGYPIEPRQVRPGHENVPQKTCWIDPWFNDALGHDPAEWLDAYAGDNEHLGLKDLVAGPISVTFEGDYMTWEYA